MESKDEPQSLPAVDDSSLLKPKPKREQSEKQKAVWAKAQQVRLDNAKAKRDVAAKVLVEYENNKKIKEDKKRAKIAKHLAVEPKVVYESESEPEIIVVKKKKQKKQQIVYEEESSEDETPPSPPPLPRERKAPTQIPIPIIPPQIRQAIRFF